MYLSEHMTRRVCSRLRGLVTEAEVRHAVRDVIPEVGETWVHVKSLPKPIARKSPRAKDGWVNGDVVWAVVRRRDEQDQGAVVTVMLRRSGQEVTADHVVGGV